MTEQQIQEMVDEVRKNGMVHREIREWDMYAAAWTGITNPQTEWVIELRRRPHLHARVSAVAPTPTDAIRAAIAMIDRIETALQEDA